MGDQQEYAGRKGISIAVLLGPDEIAAGEATVRQLEKGEQKRVAQPDIVSTIMDWLPRQRSPYLHFNLMADPARSPGRPLSDTCLIHEHLCRGSMFFHT